MKRTGKPLKLLSNLFTMKFPVANCHDLPTFRSLNEPVTTHTDCNVEVSSSVFSWIRCYSVCVTAVQDNLVYDCIRSIQLVPHEQVLFNMLFRHFFHSFACREGSTSFW